MKHTYELYTDLELTTAAMQTEQAQLARLTRAADFKRNDTVLADGKRGTVRHLTLSPSGNGAYVLLDCFPQDPMWFTLDELTKC